MKKVPVLDVVFVSIQLLLFIIYLLPVEWGAFSVNSIFKIISMLVFATGMLILVMALLGLKSNLTPFPSPKSNATLIQSGLYKYIRHPIYTGIIFAALGLGFYNESLWKILIALALWLLFYFKSGYEEKQLSAAFPQYLAYRKKTGRFIPFI